MSGRTAGTRRGAANSGVDKAWASGRVLTPEQRARKQEADRKANRFLKKEVQDRLAHLEARVLELESRDVDLASPLPGDDSFTTGTTAQQGDAGLTKSVPRAVDAGISLPTASVKLGPRGGQEHAQGSSAGSHHFEPQRGQSIDRGTEGFLRNAQHPTAAQETSTAYATAAEGPMITDPVQAGQELAAPDLTDVVTSARTRPDGRHLTCFLNNLVNYIRTMSPAAVCFDDGLNQDLIVSAVLKGWEHTLCRYQRKCPLWDVLRLVDSYLFKDCNMVERISVLRMLHKRYLYEVNANLPTAGPPPPWFRPQFSEKIFFHDPVIDHLTWPRLRERLIASETDRLTNRFWALFVKNLRVTWQREPFDIMSFSGDKQLYQLTSDFESSIMDITNWRMDMDFFRGIPQLAQDVPPYNYMPIRIVSPKLGPSQQLPDQQADVSPQFGLQTIDQQGQQPPEPVSEEDAWMPQNTAFADPNSAMDMSKMGVPGGTWNDFYS